MAAEQPNKELEEQNRKAQEEARRQIEEEDKKRLKAQVEAVEGKAPEKDYTFQAAAKELEETQQPPNRGSAVEDRARADKTGQTTTAPRPAPSAPKPQNP
jgi:hypothetical protein